MKKLIFENKRITNKGVKLNLFEYFDGKKTLIKKNMSLNTKTTKKIKIHIICQIISSGKSLRTVLEDENWAPSEYEFYLWLEENSKFRALYHEAKKMRAKGMIEKLFKIVEQSKTSKENIDEAIKVLEKISKIMEKDLEKDNTIIINVFDSWQPKKRIKSEIL